MGSPRPARRVFAAAIGMLVALVGVECFARITHHELARPTIRDANGQAIDIAEVANYRYEPGSRSFTCYDRPRWDYFDDQGCLEVKINSLGFRDEEFALEREASEVRILAIGDSFTFGVGVPAEDSWPERVEENLRVALGRPVQVINAGLVLGFRPALYQERMAQEIDRLRPDMVLVGFCLNDIHIDVPMLAAHPELPEPPLGGASVLLNRISAWRARRAFEARSTQVPEAVIERWMGKYLVGDSWANCRAALTEMQTVAQAKGVGFGVVVFPMFSYLRTTYPYRYLHQAVGDFCQEAGIPSLDLMKTVRDAAVARDLRDEDFWVHPHDQHPAQLGHRLMADAISDWVRDRL